MPIPFDGPVQLEAALTAIGHAVQRLAAITGEAPAVSGLQQCANGAAGTAAKVASDVVGALHRETAVLGARRVDATRYASVVAHVGSDVAGRVGQLGHFLDVGVSNLAGLVPSSSGAPVNADYGVQLAAAIATVATAYGQLAAVVANHAGGWALPPLDKALAAAATVLSHAPPAVLAVLEPLVPLATVTSLGANLGAAGGGPAPTVHVAHAGHAALGDQASAVKYLSMAATVAGVLETSCAALAKIVSAKLTAAAGGKVSGDVGGKAGWAAALSAKVGFTIFADGELRVSVAPVDVTGAVFAVIGCVFGLIKIGCKAAADVLALG
ncbi:MAG TPA: hypothetical protein VHE35_00115 [Kofleriaceae bacterium]|nr:hypothetical protein [Kofleriaceae bacterium]